MKNILHNFWITLRSYPFVVALNIVGLGIAIAVTYMIVVQVYYELSYNKGIKDAERIVRIEARGHAMHEPERWQALNSENIIDAVSDIVGIEALGVLNMNEWPNEYNVGDADVSLTLSFASDDIFSLLPFEIVEGGIENLLPHSNILISESFARRHNLSVGSKIIRNTNHFNSVFFSTRELVVAAVFSDFDDNSDFAALDVIVSIRGFKEIYLFPKEQNIYVAYVKLAPGYSVEELNKAINEKLAAEAPETNIEMRAMPLADTHFYGAEIKGAQKGSLTATIALIAIAVVLLSIAFVNYFNFFLSLMPRRIRSVNTHKIMGASMQMMRVTFIVESVIMVLLSFVVAMLVMMAVEGSELSVLFTAPLSLSHNSSLLFVILCVALLFAVIVALYPAFYVTSFTPAIALNGNFARNRGGTRLRMTLMIMQFAVSFVLIIVAVFIRVQNNFMLNANVGFDKEAVLIATSKSDNLTLSDHSALRDRICTHPDIIDAAFANYDLISYSPNKANVAIIGESDVERGSRSTERASIVVLNVSWNFPQVMGFEIYDGRALEYDELPTFTQTENMIEFIPGGYICNEQARKLYSLKIGDCIDDTRTPVVGFCHNFNFRPLQYAVEPLAVGLSRELLNPSIYVRVAPGYNLKEVAEHIRAASTDYFNTDNSSMEVRLVDDIMRSEYRDEQLKALQISSFATVAIIVSIIGLLATVLFEVKYIEREIALRRIHGATVWSIVRLINIKYLRMIAISFIIALPVAMHAVYEWLSNFAYKTNIYWWIFAIVLLSVSAVAVIVVTITCWHTANRNPLDVINKG